MTNVENWPLLEGALLRIITNPESWEQGSWGHKTHCGTSFCLAGHINVLAGAKPVWAKHRDPAEYISNFYRWEGRDREPDELAIELAGLNDDDLVILGVNAEFGPLFGPTRTLYQLLKTAHDWAAEDGYRLSPTILGRLAELEAAGEK